MQSESLDTSIDNICRTADNTADIVQCYCVPISSWLLSLAVCYVLYSAASLEIDIMHYNDEELLSFPLIYLRLINPNTDIFYKAHMRKKRLLSCFSLEFLLNSRYIIYNNEGGIASCAEEFSYLSCFLRRCYC